MLIDSVELIRRISKIDPFWMSGVNVKWEIIKIIKQMAEEQK